MAAGLAVLVGGCASSQRVRQEPGATLPPLPPTVSVRRRPTTTVAVAVTYVVREGDTLDVIAARLRVELDVLVTLNAIADPDRLEVGQILQVPPPTTSSASTTP